MTCSNDKRSAVFGYVDGLDALRLAAVSIVIVAHYNIVPLVPGGLGVSIFFFISGFLITRLLIAEEKAEGHIHLGEFYVRRFIRLLPPLFLMGGVVVPLLILVEPNSLSVSQIALSFGYFGNLHKIGVQLFGWGQGYGALEPLWSLAVEEHFYLLLPPALLVMRSPDSRVKMISLLLAGALFLRVLIWWWLPAYADDINYNFTLTRLDAIGWGVLLTLLLDRGLFSEAFFERWAWWLVIGGAISVLISLWHWSPVYEEAIKYTPQTVAIAMAFCGFILPKRTEALRRIAEFPFIRYFGKISYELYLWHLPVLVLVRHVMGAGVTCTAISLLLTGLVSSLAYTLTTKKLAPLRRRFGGHPV